MVATAAFGSEDPVGPQGSAPVQSEPPPARAGAGGPVRCTSDGVLCISKSRYVADVCRILEHVAEANDLDPHFFARLVWKESLFDAAAVSPAGAEGIAQFMPGTAQLRGLDDPFNPAEALAASARYLADLRRDLGNIGLAAVAYNGGENRAARFVAGEGGLPLETRDYVFAITGWSAESWRDAPPEAVDLALAAGPFRPACEAHAAKRGRSGTEFRDPLDPWGVIVASHRTRDGAERQAGRLLNRHRTVLGGESVAYARARLPGMPRRLYNAQIGRVSRAKAEALCAALRADGAACMVLRN